jgi:hypothetical protein
MPEPEQDLFSLLPTTLQRDPRAFDARGKIHEWDQAVYVWLLCQRYETQAFYTVDGDSFGPLVRGVRARRLGEQHWHLYTYG